MRAPSDHPIADVEWIDPTTLRANDYNPNHVAPAELRLLKTSLMENGWTMPLVARPDGEIVDGFHRWTIALGDADVRALTGGLVPVVRLRSDPATQRMATIRHNRARGSHHVVKMADIVAALVEMGVSPAEVGARLSMDTEEVDRLLDRGQMTKRGPTGPGFSRGWTTGIRDVGEAGTDADPAPPSNGRQRGSTEPVGDPR